LGAIDARQILDMHRVRGMLGVRGPDIVDVSPGGALTRAIDLCESVDRLAADLARPQSSPVFFYSRPQNAQMGVAAQRVVPAGESYPGFDDRVASSVHRLDACIGKFVDFLKRR